MSASQSSSTPPRLTFNLNQLWRCYTYLRPYRRITLGAYLATTVIMLLNLALPQFIRWIIDHGIREQRLDLLGWSVSGLLVLTLVKGVLIFVQGRWSEIASQSVAYDLRNEIQRKLTNLSFAYHNQSETGELLSRAMQDVERIRFLTGRATLRLIESVLLFVGTIVVLLWMNASLAWVAIAVMPILAYQALAFGRRFRPLSLEIQKQMAILTTRVEQNLRGSRVVKAFAQEQAEIERFERENESWFVLSAEASRLQAVNLPFLMLVANLGTVLILWAGGRQVIQQGLTLGELVAFTTYLAQFVNPMRLLGLIIPAIAMASASAERIFEVLDATTDVYDAPDAIPLPPVQGHVRLEGVSFGYARREVLRDINIDARPGQIIALLGPTGAGKSSIVNLIPRF